MSEWRELKIGDIATYINRGVAPKYVENEGNFILNQKCVRNGRLDFTFSKKTSPEKKYSEEKKVISHDILINSTGVGTAGRVCIFPTTNISYYVDTHVSILRLNKGIVFPKYVFYNLFGREKEIEGYAEGSTGQIELSRNKIAGIDILLPPLAEQQAIAEVLGSLDDKIDLLHRQNATLEKMAETLFRQWFIEQAKPEWEEGNIYRLLDVIYGYPFKSKYFNENKNGLPLIRIRDLKNGHSTIYTYEECDKKYHITYGDLVAGMDGEFRLYMWSGEESVLNQRACKFEPKHDYVPHLFIYSLMKPHLYFYKNTKVGTTVIHLGKADLDEIKISIPPKELLCEYGDITNEWFQKLKNNYKQIRTLTALRDTLLPKLMSGEVRVI